MRDDIRKLPLDGVRAAYRKYLHEQNLSKNTIMTSSIDAFYIWRKQGDNSFWNIVLADNFETLGKETLLELLRKHSRGDVEANASSYMAHLRKFRKFVLGTPVIAVSEITPAVSKNRENSTVKEKYSLPTPSIEQVEFYLAQWDGLKDYHLQEDALNRLFFDLCPENRDISDILLKVSVLNDFYSTNIFKVFHVAKRIQSLQIDERLRSSVSGC